jgi:AcrR family transcriptional regulator
LRGIARAGGWTTGIVSYYFVDKRDLLIATFRSRADAARQRMEQARAGGASGLEAIIDNALPLDDEQLAGWKVFLAFWAAAVGDDELSAIHVERHRTFAETVEHALRAERDAGRLGADLDLAHEAHCLITLLDGVALQAVLQPNSWTPERQRRIVDDHLARLATAEDALRPG